MKFYVATLMVLLFFSSEVCARTWYVEKDGSGDFINLQIAADAAASGDTIHIGPGRFNDIASSECLDQHPHNPYRMTIHRAEMTLIGAGSGATIIGPESWNPDWQVGIIVVGDCGNRRLYLRDIRFENLGDCINAIRGQILDIDSCEFYNFNRGLVTNSNHNRIVNCNVESKRPSSYFITTAGGWDTQTMDVINCQTSIQGIGYSLTGGAETLLIDSCSFDGAGLNLGGGHSQVKNCSISNSDVGIIAAYGLIQAENCIVSGVRHGIWQDSLSPLTEIQIQSCTFSDIEDATYLYQSFQSGYIRNCLLEKGDQYVVGVRNPINPTKNQSTKPMLIPNMGSEKLFYSVSVLPEPTIIQKSNYHFDMTDNWWGTTDPDSIQSWILDGKDLEDWDYFIDYEPFKDQPVPNQRKSLGGIKSMFRSSGS